MVDLTVRRSAAVRAAGVDHRRVKRTLEVALKTLALAEAEVSVVLCDSAFIRPLNEQWRGIDAATDVLSFPQNERIPGDPIPPEEVLGDIVIDVQTAARQAEELGHDATTEAVVLVVHGLLHLLGYEHEEDEAGAERMSAEEARLLAVIGTDPRVALVARAR